jgi:hypothetical protein
MKGVLVSVVGVLSVVSCVVGAPSTNMEQGAGGGGRLINVQSVLGRNRVKTGEVDPQTQNDLRILSLFENELNKIFSCYIRLACPRTRSPQVIMECQEIKDWPLYHQVMRMSGIKRYPYQNYAPQRQTPVGDNALQIVDDDTETPRVRRHHRRHRRTHTDQNET